MQVGFIGMSHLGLNSAVAAAERGAKIACYDPNVDTIKALKQGHTLIKEPDLERLLKKHAQEIHFSSSIDELASCELVYIALDVETDDQGNSNLAPLGGLIALADQALPESVILVVLSQIPPGFSRSLSLKKNRSYYYQVETLVFGDAIRRALNPERFIIGTPNPKLPLPRVFEEYLGLYACPILPMRFESAELCKISINCCLVASVTIANTLAELCERIGADWSEIIPALKSDRRIGQYAYLSPGLGIAGGNLERDLNTVQVFAKQHQTEASVIDAYLHNSSYRKDWPYHTLKRLFKDQAPAKIAVWGLTYKVDTHSLKNSPSIHFLTKLRAEYKDTIELSCYDPVISALPELNINIAHSALSACDHANVLIVMTPWAHFSSISPREIAQHLKGALVLDPYGALDQIACEASGLTYLTLGKSPVKDYAGSELN